MIDVGVREGIWALVAVLALYLVVILFRLALPLRAGSAGEGAGSPQTVVVEAPVPRVPDTAPAAASALPEVPRETLNELEIQQLRRDVSQLRTEQDFLRSELVAMRLDMNDMQAVRERVQAQPPTQQYVRPESPQHSEAMLLAGRGISAAQIADHCGISVAEAELVCELARAEGGT